MTRATRHVLAPAIVQMYAWLYRMGILEVIK